MNSIKWPFPPFILVGRRPWERGGHVRTRRYVHDVRVQRVNKNIALKESVAQQVLYVLPAHALQLTESLRIQLLLSCLGHTDKGSSPNYHTLQQVYKHIY